MALVKYMCTYCGKRVTRFDTQGRPDPGTCPRKPNKGPHSWVRDN